MTSEEGLNEQDPSPGTHVQLAAHRVVDVVEGMHHAIAKPWFTLAGPAADGLHRIHHAGTSGMYGLVRLGGSAVAKVIDRSSSKNSTYVTAASAVASAIWGDDPARPAGADTTIRDSTGGLLQPSLDGLAAGFPNAKQHLIVLVHGLGQTERCWNNTVISLGDDSSVIRIRYNTGLPIFSSASEVASLLDQVVAHWPVEVNEIVLVGYSMGGLVARAAANQAESDTQGWVAHTRHVITIAAPLLGSPIEKGAEVLARGLVIAPQTRPLAEFVSSRSQGIKDLRHGSVANDVLPDHIEHHCIAAVVTRNATHPVGRLLGDLVVRTTSATGRGRHRSIEHSSMHLLGGRSHANALDAPELSVLLGSILRGPSTAAARSKTIALNPKDRT